MRAQLERFSTITYGWRASIASTRTLSVLAPDCVILERRGVFRGRDGARELARLLSEELPDAPYTYANRLIDGRMAFLEWTAETENARVRDGADSFLIEDGWIVAQTIHYTVETK